MSDMKQPRKLNTSAAKGTERHVYHSGSQPSGGSRRPASSGTSRHISRSAPSQRAETYRAAPPPPDADGAAALRRGKGKKKKKNGCLKVFLLLILILAALFFIAFKVITSSVTGDVTISQLINTPSEYKGDVVNVLVCGVDWEEGRAYSDASSNDGMTDMVMYVSFDVANKKISMLQIPRNTYVGGSYTTESGQTYNASNGQINSVMLSNEGGINALAETINDQLKLPVDYYITINMQSLHEVVDTFGGIEVYVPQDIEYNGSVLKQGYQTLDGAAAEFFVRNRKGAGYERSDLDRLNMQRYFYSGLLGRFRTMNIWDVAKLMPAFMNYVETDMPSSTMISLGVSLLQVDSANIMISQMPVYGSSQYYNNNSVVVGAPEETAELLNTYFRTYTGEVPASELNLQSWYPTGEASDPNVQFMGQLDEESIDAQQNNNLDGSNTSYK